MLACVALLAPPASAAVTIGAGPGVTSANLSVCTLEAPAGTERTCTDAQYPGWSLNFAEAGLVAPFDGTIVSWRVVSGAASPATRAVKLRLRMIDGVIGGTGSAFASLPLNQPGPHTFPARLRVREGERIGLDAVVTSAGGGLAAAPIARLEPNAGHIQEWSPSLLGGFDSAPTDLGEGSQLLLSAKVEPERIPPRTKLTYANRQDFLRSRSVVVYLRSNEPVEALAAGQLEFATVPGKPGRTIYGLHAKRLEVGAGEKTAMRLQLPRTTWEAAMRATGSGKPVVVKVTVSAEDAAGNRAGTTVATIRPPR